MKQESTRMTMTMTDCVEAPGCRDANGYARYWYGRRNRGPKGKIQDYAHRVAYMQAHGLDDLPEGYHVHHECGRRDCINPGHLTLMLAEEHNAHHLPMARAMRWAA